MVIHGGLSVGLISQFTHKELWPKVGAGRWIVQGWVDTATGITT